MATDMCDAVHIIGDILPDYLLQASNDASWDIQDIHKALNVSYARLLGDKVPVNVCKTWNTLVKSAKKEPTRYILLRKECETNIIVDQECLNAMVLAIKKDDIGVPEAINTIDNGRFFDKNGDFDEAVCFETIHYLADFVELCDSNQCKLVVMYMLYIFMQHHLLIRKQNRVLKIRVLDRGYKIIQNIKDVLNEHAAIMVPNMEKALRSIKYRRYFVDQRTRS